MTAPDGASRCIPTASALYDATGSASAFSDPACTQLLVQVPTTCFATPYAFTGTSGGCGIEAVTAINAVGATYTGTVYTASGGACAPAQAPGALYAAVGAAVDPSTFAPVTVSVK